MITMKSKCNKDTLCVDCTSTCTYAGQIGADCPKYKCDNDKPMDCQNCKWIQEYINILRNDLRKQK